MLWEPFILPRCLNIRLMVSESSFTRRASTVLTKYIVIVRCRACRMMKSFRDDVMPGDGWAGKVLCSSGNTFANVKSNLPSPVVSLFSFWTLPNRFWPQVLLARVVLWVSFLAALIEVWMVVTLLAAVATLVNGEEWRLVACVCFHFWPCWNFS